MSDSQPHFRFLDLQREIRDMIYALVVEHVTGRTVITVQNRFAICKRMKPASKLTIRSKHELRFLAICSTIREEIAPFIARDSKLVIDHIVCDCHLCAGRWSSTTSSAWTQNLDYLRDLYLEHIPILEIMTCEPCVISRRRQPILPSDLPTLRILILHEDDLVYQDFSHEKNALENIRKGRCDESLVRWIFDRSSFHWPYRGLYEDIEDPKRKFQVIYRITALVCYEMLKGVPQLYLLRILVDKDTQRMLSRRGLDVTHRNLDYDCQFSHNVGAAPGVLKSRGGHGRLLLPCDREMEELLDW